MVGTTDRSSVRGCNTDLRGEPDAAPAVPGVGTLLTEPFPAELPKCCSFIYLVLVSWELHVSQTGLHEKHFEYIFCVRW
jgi:hypothetical protein